MPGIARNPFRSRLAHKLFLAFAACAALPFLAAGALAVYEIRELTAARTAEELRDVSSGFGMSIIGTLNAADATLRALTADVDGDEAAILQRAARIELFRRVRLVSAAPAPPQWPADRAVPWPSPAQQRALAAGRSVLLWDRGDDGEMSVFLARLLHGGSTWLYVELDPHDLWGLDQLDARAGGVLVATRTGEVLYASKRIPPAQTTSALQMLRSAGRPTSSADTGTWASHVWEAFLDGAFATPSWYVIALEPPASAFEQLGTLRLAFPGLLALTLLVVLWLSSWKIRQYLEPMESLLEGTRRVSRREFDTVLDVHSDDEISELARSFNRMASSLKHQFEALETMAAVDRLLMRSPGLEQVLDALLPHVSSVLGCSAVAVLLVEADAPEHGRVYDFAGRHRGALPVRRVAVEPARLEALLKERPCATLPVAEAAAHGLLELLPPARFATLQLWPLRQGQRLAGVLSIGFLGLEPPDVQTTGRASDFADRLSVVIANVEHEELLYRQAHFDPLTQLPNRQLFCQRLSAELASCTGGVQGALLYIDLDHFKRVNDTAGHGTGDELLKVVAQRLVGCVKEGDTVARLGGDEFAVVLPRIAAPQVARSAAERILGALAQPFHFDGRDHYVAASIGVTVFPADGVSADDLLKNGDIAMYRAKEAGRGQAVFFEPEMNARMLARTALETGLHHALRRQQFELHYQPLVSSRDGTVVGVEALLRWCGADGSSRSPQAFIAAAEESGLIVEIGRWVSEAACRQLAAWRRAGVPVPGLSINVSPRQLRENDFVADLLAILERHELAPEALQIEITENVIADGAHAERALLQLADSGVRIALDDFGTGYSSLSYLRTYPIHSVKVDRSFITDVPGSTPASRLVETIILMGHALDKQVVAEGVETAAQLHFLRERGCDVLQGFLIARPLDSEALAAFVRERARQGSWREAS